jgi:hypothetical protein
MIRFNHKKLIRFSEKSSRLIVFSSCKRLSTEFVKFSVNELSTTLDFFEDSIIQDFEKLHLQVSLHSLQLEDLRRNSPTLFRVRSF